MLVNDIRSFSEAALVAVDNDPDTYGYFFLNESDQPASERLVNGLFGVLMTVGLSAVVVVVVSSLNKMRVVPRECEGNDDIEIGITGENRAQEDGSSTSLPNDESMT